MHAFTIDADNNITVDATKKAARETGAGVFDTAKACLLSQRVRPGGYI